MVHTNELLSCDKDATIYLSTGETIFNHYESSNCDLWFHLLEDFENTQISGK
jgi:hypothetical protein